MSEAQEQLWKDTIIDHGQFPRKHGRIEAASHQGKGENPFCGDRVSLQLKLKDGVIADVGFEATGCAISLSSASLLADNLLGKSASEAQALFESVHSLLTGNQSQSDLGELEALALVTRYPARVKCASLVWHVLRNALQGEEATASTE
jgi:nitrogen fixation NifU-like protein